MSFSIEMFEWLPLKEIVPQEFGILEFLNPNRSDSQTNGPQKAQSWARAECPGISVDLSLSIAFIWYASANL